jgi:hypothetical protein
MPERRPRISEIENKEYFSNGHDFVTETVTYIVIIKTV